MVACGLPNIKTKGVVMTDEAQSKGPELFAYTVRETGEKSYFTKIGAVFAHAQGGGFTINLEAHPIDRKIVLFPPRQEEDTAPTASKS